MAGARAHFDVAVIGGGPAGAATARLVAWLGHTVVLCHAEPRQHGPEVESLPPSAAPILQSVGLAEVVAEAAVARAPGNTVIWAGSDRTETPFAEQGFQISRRELDPRLRFAAAAAGAEVREARVRSLDLTARPSVIEVDQAGRALRLTSDVVVLATGRRGALRGAGRVTLGDWRTLALVGAWDGREPGGPAWANTWIESTDRGWVWAVPLDGKRLQLTAMIDPPKGGGLSGGSLERHYRREIARAPAIAGRVADQAVLWVRAIECTPSFVPAAAQDHCLRVGDAASFVDPLSSFGLKKAFASARLAAAVVHTLRHRPASAAGALAAYDAFLATEFAGSMAGAAEEVARARRHHDTPFWKRRTFRPPLVRAPAPPVDREPAQAGRWRLGPGVRLETRAVLEGWLFEEQRVVVSERWPQGLRYLQGVTVPELVEALVGGAPLDAETRPIDGIIEQLVGWRIVVRPEST